MVTPIQLGDDRIQNLVLLWEEGWLEGPAYRIVNSTPASYSGAQSADAIFEAVRSQRYALGEALLSFGLHAAPFGTTLDYATQGDAGNAGLSAVGDAILVGKAFRMYKWVRRVFQLAVGVEAGIGFYRLGSAGYNFTQGDYGGAAGDFAEAVLRLWSAKVDWRQAYPKLKPTQLPPTPRGGVAPNSGQARTVFRGERSSRSTDVVFEQGLQPKGANADLLRHATGNQPDTNFIATSLRPSIAKGFAGKNGHVYVIRTKNGIDVNVTLGSKSPFPEQFEIAIPGGVGNSEIMGAFKMHNGNIVGEFIPNPAFVK